MKKALYFALVISIISCNKDSEIFPKSYTIDRIEQQDEGLYLVENGTLLSDLAITTGLYGAYRDTLKSDIRASMEVAFNLIEIELLNEDSLFFHYSVDDEEFDTIFSYSNIDGDIRIDSLQGTLLTFEKEDDQFVVCGRTRFAIPGPNAYDPDLPYNGFTVTECTPGSLNESYAYQFLNQFDFARHDTIGIVVTRYIYK